jgi:hypothetical protein
MYGCRDTVADHISQTTLIDNRLIEGLIPAQSIWDLWCTEWWQWDRFLLEYFCLSIIISPLFHIHIYSSVIDAVCTIYGEYQLNKPQKTKVYSGVKFGLD